jgi:asparagine synthase (glutamine-hydrolysing)
VTQYWDALPPSVSSNGNGAESGGKGAESDEEQRAEVLRLLRESIRKRMMADVPFGVFLSGGVDSSANVALMSEQTARPVRTFTVAFSDHEELNELDSARAVAQRFATDHHEILIGEREMRDFLPRLVFHQDEPIADPVCVPLYYVAQLARDTGTIVVQVGEGADEIFSGYEWIAQYLRIHERFWRHAARLPAAARRVAAASAAPFALRAQRAQRAAELSRRLASGESLFWGGTVIFDETIKPRVLSEETRRRTAGLSSYDVVREYEGRIASARPASDFLARLTYLELKLRLPELLLMRVDKLTMAASVEARVPFLDHRLVEYAMGLPRASKVEGRVGKHVLKRALEGVLPRDLLYRRKRGFGAPINAWLRGGASDLLDGHLLNSPMRRRAFLDYDFVARLVEEHRRGARDWSFHLWGLLNLSLWYERWVEGKR